MGDEIVNLLINLGIEVDEKGNVKKINKDLKDMQDILRKLAASKGGNTNQLNKALSSALPDEAKIKKFESRINSLNNLLAQTRKQIAAIKNPPIEKITQADIDKVKPKTSLMYDNEGKLIKTTTSINKKGEETVREQYREYVEEAGERLVRDMNYLEGDLVKITDKVKKGLVGYTAGSGSFKGNLYKTTIDPETNDIVEWTKELNGNLLITRKYINGVLAGYSEITKEQKKQIKETFNDNIALPSTAKLIGASSKIGANGKLSTIKVYQDVVEKDGQKLVKTYKEINGKVVNETEKLVNNTLTKTAKPKGGIEKFVNRVKNIVVYRLVRTVMSAIGRSITEGLNLIAVNNSGAREILTDFKSATTSLSISISTMLLPIMQSLSSMLTNIGDKFIDVANYMSRQNALTQGQATYYKINKKAVDDYAKSLTALSGNLSQLDKFATLSGTNNPILGGQVSVDEAVNISSDTQKMLDTVRFFLDKIGDLLIWVKDNFKELVKVIMIFAGASVLFKLISGLSSILSVFKLIFSQSGLLLGGIALLVTAFSSDLPLASKMLIGALGGLAVALAIVVALKQFLTKDIGVAIAGLGLVAGGISAFVAGISSKTADSGSSATSSGLASATNINSLMSGVATNGGYSQSTVASNSNYVIKGNVYMSGEEVGQITSASVSRQQKKTGTGNFYK